MQTETTAFVAKNGWQQVKAPELIKLEKVGDEITGVLLDLFHENIMDNGLPRKVLTARMEVMGGEQVKFRPSFDLSQKIGRRHIGRTMLIVFDSLLDTGKDSKMKVFQVWLKPEGGEHVDSDPPFIATEADLPLEL